jgi:hypothetical protein
MRKSIAQAIFTAVVVTFLAAVSLQAGSVTNRPLAMKHIPTQAGITATALLQFPSLSSDKNNNNQGNNNNNQGNNNNNKKKTVTPEPSTWLYVSGAILLLLILERKSLKALFQPTSAA